MSRALLALTGLVVGGARLLTGIAPTGFAVVVVLLGSGSVARGGGTAVPRPVTLLTAKGLIEGFAQDGPWIVWADRSAPCQSQVKVRRASGGAARSLLSTQGATCHAVHEDDDGGRYQPSMALAGTRALWAKVVGDPDVADWSAVVRTGAPAGVDRELIAPGLGHRRSVPLTGDGSTLLYVDRETGGGKGFGGDEVFRVLADGHTSAFPRTWGTQVLSASGSWFAAGRVLPAATGSDVAPVWSPDGSRVLFSRWPAQRPFGDVWVVGSDGSHVRNVTSGVEHAGAWWSPDSRRLLVRDAVAGGLGIAILDLDTGHRTVASRKPVDLGSADPAWSPDGRRIAFVLSDGLYVAAADGTAARRVAPAPVIALAWSPDGRRLAFVLADGLYVAAADGTQARSLDPTPASEFAWSRGGDRIAWVGRSNGLYVASADGSGERKLYSGSMGSPTWSPDGTALAVVDSVDHGGESSIDEVRVVQADGSRTWKLYQADELNYVYNACWSRDGANVTFILRERMGMDSGDFSLVRVRRDGTGLHASGTLFSEGDGRKITAWRWSPDGSRLAVALEEWGYDPYRLTDRWIDVFARDGTRVARQGKATTPGWSADGASLAFSDGRSLHAAVVGGAARRLTATPPAVPAWSGVEVRNARTGATRLRLAIKCVPAAVALTPQRIAVLVRQGKAKRIQVYGLGGAAQRSVAVAGATADELAAGGRWVVYRSGRTISAFDVRSGSTRVLAVAGTVPVGLSLEGRRLAWVEPRTAQTRVSRIRALTLPR